MSSRYVSILLGTLLMSTLVADSGEHETEAVELSIREPFFVKPTTSELKAALVQKPFSPFTGKVKGRKVRLRAQPDLDGRVVRELGGQDMLVVVGEKGDFYAVEPPSGLKAYVFRSFVLDGVVEGNRVNV